MSNLLAGIGGTVPNVVNPAGASFIQITGVASRRVGYFIGGILLVMAFLPKVSGLISTIPGPVMTGYLIMVTGTLFIDGARTVIQSEPNRQKVVVAGVCFWIGASFQFGLFHLPDLGPAWGALFKSGITTGGIAAVVMILYLELTNPRRMRFQSKLHIDSLPELNEFIAKFADSRGWGSEMKDKLSAVAEETLLTLAPLDLTSFDMDEEEDEDDGRQLIVLASSEESVADLEFIGGGIGENLEDQVRQLQELEIEIPAEHEISLPLLQNYASSVSHQQLFRHRRHNASCRASRDVTDCRIIHCSSWPLWIPAPYRCTGQALRRYDGSARVPFRGNVRTDRHFLVDCGCNGGGAFVDEAAFVEAVEVE